MATVYVRNNSWVLNWSDAEGQHRRVIGRTKTMTKREAQAAALAKDLELRSNIALLPGTLSTRPQVPTLQAFSVDYLNWYSQAMPDTFWDVHRRVLQQINPAFGHYQLDSIPRIEAERWKHARAQNVKASTANLEVRTLRAMLNKAVEWDIIVKNPLAKFPDLPTVTAEVPRFFTKEELERIYRVPQKHESIYPAVWKLMANTGLRRNEALQLQWRDVHSGRVHVYSRENARTKGRKMRAVPLNTEARAALVRLKLQTGGSEFVLPEASSDNLTHRFKIHARRAGIPDGHLHMLRHTFASHLVMAGVDLRTVQTYMGHSSIEITEVYAHLSPEHLQTSAERIAL